MDETLWLIFRDESQKELIRKVEGCLAQYRQRTGADGNVVMVSCAIEKEEVTALEVKGVKVMNHLPSWAKSEIWVGRRAEPSGTGVKA